MSHKAFNLVNVFEEAILKRENERLYPSGIKSQVDAEYNAARKALLGALETGFEIAEELTAQYEAGAQPITDAAKAGS